MTYSLESGLILYYNIIFVINIKIFLMSHHLSPALIFSVVGTLVWYWGTYIVIMLSM